MLLWMVAESPAVLPTLAVPPQLLAVAQLAGEPVVADQLPEAAEDHCAGKSARLLMKRKWGLIRRRGFMAMWMSEVC